MAGSKAALIEEVSPAYRAYFAELEQRAQAEHKLASALRQQGRDPERHVEILLAKDLPSRVEKQLLEYDLGPIAEPLRGYLAEMDREPAALELALEIAGRFPNDPARALDGAVRAGLSVITEGILVAPLEGIGKVVISGSGTSAHVEIYFSGPIRSAGGTGQAMSVLLADLVRRKLGLARYVPTRDQVARYQEEVQIYNRIHHLQYLPTNEQVETIARGVPVCITGDPTEQEEVAGNRDVAGVEGNRVRGGACLVLAEGIIQKAAKLKKHVDKLAIDGWEFLDGFLVAGGGESDARPGPSDNYLRDMVAGRPILGHPSRRGGFRLRYGRVRTSGLAALAFNPATLHLLDDFIAIGTQVKTERPGKACIATPADCLQGAMVLLKDGNHRLISDLDEVPPISAIDRITDLGEILVPFGEFLENNHPLMPVGYEQDWQEALVLERGVPAPPSGPSLGIDLDWCAEHGMPLPPRWALGWEDLDLDRYLALRDGIRDSGTTSDDAVLVPPDHKEDLIRLCVPFTTEATGIRVGPEWAELLVRALGLTWPGLRSGRKRKTLGDTLATVGHRLGVEVRPRAATRIGARMARPEKADARRMKPPPHGLFPVGLQGGPQRLLEETAKANLAFTNQAKASQLQVGRPARRSASAKRPATIEMAKRICTTCKITTPWYRCAGCELPTELALSHEGEGSTEAFLVDYQAVIGRSLDLLGIPLPPKVKGVRGLMSKLKTPEDPVKGILRAAHGIHVYKDGTTRFDTTNAPLTHFRPGEIGLSVTKAQELGYTRAADGSDLVDEDQLVELLVQDVVVPAAGLAFLYTVAGFVDELLVKVYGSEPFYRCQTPEDLFGQLIIGLAPHTSGGILARIIGVTATRVGYGHPFFHAAKRRNCDGDEDSLMLLLDGFLDFSRRFLPSTLGGQMDAPLVLTLRIDPREIDKEAHNLDVSSRYPLALYEAAAEYASPKTLAGIVPTVGDRLGTPAMYEGLGITHPSTAIGAGPTVSNYTILETMVEKMEGQLRLAGLVDAIDSHHVASLVVTKHFIPDMIGNLKKFSTQKVRCNRCSKSFRRVPLRGVCPQCGSKLLLTVHEASVKKYLQVSRDLVQRYPVEPYLRQRIELIGAAIESVFGREKVRAATLVEFL